jgi:hypothetical protein
MRFPFLREVAAVEAACGLLCVVAGFMTWPSLALRYALVPFALGACIIAQAVVLILKDIRSAAEEKKDLDGWYARESRFQDNVSR